MLIRIKNIRTNPVLGVYTEERHKRQPVILNLAIEYNEGNAPQTDHISDALDYCELTRRIVNAVDDTNFQLIETLIEFVLDRIFEEPLALSATVEIDKPEALKEFADSVSVTASRSRR